MDNKKVLIAGGSGFIGQKLASLLIDKGFDVSTLTRKPKNSKDIFWNPITREINLSQLSEIDVLVNCAGMQVVSPLDKYPEETWRKLMDINLNAAFYMTKYTLPIMRKNKWGRIINISSTHGLIASINKSAYTASKHGIVGLTKVTALETAKEKITCNSICPGFVLTEFIQDQIDVIAKKFKLSDAKAQIKLLQDKQPSLRFVQKSHIADLIYFLCSDSASEITGANIPIDGGWTSQ